MIRDLLKWVVPGLATVLGGTALCLVFTSANIANDISARGGEAMRASGYAWADLSVDARDIRLTGTATETAQRDTAIARLVALPGVRSVSSDVTLAPLARPYILEASINADTVSLAGGVPDALTREKLLARAGAEQGGLDFRSGLPDRRTWLAGAEFAIDQLKYFDEAQITLSDLTVSISGRARSERSYGDLLIVMRAGAPAGVTLGEVSIRPALVSPYSWTAVSDGKTINVSGFVPDEPTIDRLRTADASGLPIATGLALGSGEPDGFDKLSQTLIKQLSRLEYGTARITDGTSSLSGAPATAEIAQSVTQQLAQAGSIVVLEPPRIEDYWITASRQPGGVVVFDGYAPDEATRSALGEREGADIQFLKLGRGAPERYQSALDFGLAALDRLSEGRFGLRGDVVTLSGIARSGADYEALLQTLAADAPQGLVLSTAEITAPRAAQYDWQATKDASGAIALSGMAPSPQAKAQLLASAGPSATEALVYASGEPNTFLQSAQTGLGLLQWLSEGRVSFDGSGWLITGTARTPIDKGALDADFTTRQLAASGWSMAVADPVPAAIAEAAPYTWSANKSLDGAIVLSGTVPADSLRRVIAVRAGAGVTDETSIDPAAPDGFAEDALAAITALAALSEGSASFDGEQWSLTGTKAVADADADIQTALASATTPPADWLVSLFEAATPAQPVIAEPVVPEDQPAVAEPQVDPAYAFSAVKGADKSVILSGQVPDDAALGAFATILAGDTASVSIAPGAPEGFVEDAKTGLEALAKLDLGQVAFSDGKWSLTGTVADQPTKDAVSADMAAAPDGTNWTVTIDVPERVAATPVAPPPAAPATKADTAACIAPLADFSARNAILFQSGAAIIAAESQPALDELAADLAVCPDAVVHVEGYTDSDGDEALNLALSVARAEAVVAALIERDVTAARLYAIGFGEANPIADNDTAAGKRLNRRIVVTVLDQHY